MKKYGLVIYKIVLIFLLIGAVVTLSLILPNKDKFVTENITLKYFEDSMNNYNPENLKEFVASSENNILYEQALKTYELNHYEGVSDYKFTIDSYEEFGNGKYQCYYNYYKEPTCDVKNEGKYMNYIIDTTTTYKTVIGEKITIKEKN